MQSVNVDIIGDTIGEMNETFTLRLEPVNENDDGVTVTFTIINDDRKQAIYTHVN